MSTPSREELERMYLVELLTDTQIAERLGIYQVKVGRLRKKYGIETIGKTGRIETSVPGLTQVQRELVIGSLLGDGYTRKSSERTASFNESHSEKQEEYLRWKGDLLGCHVSSYTTTSKREAGKVYKGIRLNGVTSTHMMEFHELFYGSGGRVFPKNLPDIMTPFVLAVWYMDDGSIMNKFHPRISFGLDEGSLRSAISALKGLGLKPVAGREGDEYGIRFPGQSELFFGLIERHIPTCMNYKLPAQSEFREIMKNARGLTSTRSAVLYEGGMTMQEIADLHGVGISTVRRRLKESGVKSRGAVPHKCDLMTQEAAEELLKDGNREPEEVLSILRRCEFPFPRVPDNELFKREVELVAGTDMHIDGHGNITPWSSVGTRLCSPYFPNRYRARSKGSVSPYEAWFEDKKLLGAIKFQMKVGDPVTPKRVLRAITMQHRTPSVFRPTVARCIYENYCPSGNRVRVWDPCSGYGGRLLGAFTAGVEYIGTDVEPETVEGNRRIAERLKFENCAIELSPAERFDPGPVDLVFTSPPYFDREAYSDREDQSWVKYGSGLEAWLEGFLRPVVRTSHKRSKILILNIADIRSGGVLVPLVDSTIRVAEEEGFEFSEKLWMPLARLNRSPEQAVEPILVFRR